MDPLGLPDVAKPGKPPSADLVVPEAASESIPLELPSADKLLPLSGKLPPIRLEASYTAPIALRDALKVALENNLAIGISRQVMQREKWLFGSALGGFLPNILMNYRQEILAGSSLIGGVIPVTFHTPNVSTSAGFQFFGFRGGLIMFTALRNMHNYRASKQGLQGSINDVLLEVSRLYYDLMRQEALLQIETLAVEVSRAQLKLNRQLQAAGTGTYFNVLQAETQLARDEQNLLTAEVRLRQAAIRLGAALNLNLAINFLSVDKDVKKVRLIDPSLDINDLIRIAILNRPELKRFEQLRMAARRNIQVNAAPLYPSFQFFGSVAGNGATLGPSPGLQPGSFQAVPLPGSTPIAGVPGQVFPAAVAFSPPRVTSRQIRRSYRLGFQVDWNYPAMGVPDLANVQAARAQARQVMLEANQELIRVTEQVRTSYLNSQTAERLVDVASSQVVSSAEQLRLARVRLANGVGINLDVIQAQQAWAQALANKANAIVDFNIAQAQLLRDLGIITVDTLTSGRLVRQ